MTYIMPALIAIMIVTPVVMLALYLIASLGLHMWRDFMDQYND
jgi:hypothetical protein